MPVAKPKVQCGSCYELYAASSMRKSPDGGPRVCRKYVAAVRAAHANRVEPKPPDLKWYALYVEIDADLKVVKELQRQALIHGKTKELTNVIAATRAVTEYKDGRPKVVQELCFPGYVIVECRWSEDMHHFLCSTRGVMGVLPLKPSLYGLRYGRKEPPKLRKPVAWEKEKAIEWKPTALESEEAARLLISQAVGGGAKPVPKTAFKVGDTVTIADGPFRSMSGPVVECDASRVKVRVKMWGRDLEVDVEPWQVTK